MKLVNILRETWAALPGPRARAGFVLAAGFLLTALALVVGLILWSWP